MAVLKTHTLPVKTENDIVHVRREVRAWAIEIKCSLVDQTKIVTAASELARNLLIYGKGGEVQLSILQEGIRRGLRVVFEDHGPGHRRHPAGAEGRLHERRRHGSRARWRETAGERL